MICLYQVNRFRYYSVVIINRRMAPLDWYRSSKRRNMMKKFILAMSVGLVLSACVATPDPKDYSSLRQSNMRSIVVVPVINKSADVDAANFFLTTLAVPLTNRGYYVYPTNMVKTLMERESLGDPNLIHTTDAKKIGEIFGADSVLYVEVLNWKASYVVVSSGITVEFLYTLKSAKNGEVLWQNQTGYYHKRSGGTGNIFADLISAAVMGAVDSSRSDYTPVAIFANGVAITAPGQGLPYGPYEPKYGKDIKEYPSTGSGKITNATATAVAWPKAQ